MVYRQINLEQRVLGADFLDFLSFQVDQHRILPLEDKVQAIR